jgi:hypothetical protein
MKREKCLKLSKVACGFALGFTFAIFVSFCLILVNHGLGSGMHKMMSTACMDAGGSMSDCFIGIVRVLIDGFVVGFIFAAIYNYFCSKRR